MLIVHIHTTEHILQFPSVLLHAALNPPYPQQPVYAFINTIQRILSMYFMFQIPLYCNRWFGGDHGYLLHSLYATHPLDAALINTIQGWFWVCILTILSPHVGITDNPWFFSAVSELLTLGCPISYQWQYEQFYILLLYVHAAVAVCSKGPSMYYTSCQNGNISRAHL